MRGKKGIPHDEPDDPPRRRGNQAVDHGTWETDRPPVPGVTGRQSGRLRVRVGRRSGSAELVDATVLPATEPGAMVSTDEWNGYNPLGRRDLGHASVNHNRGEFARDDDGDGIREVHCDTMEGIWTGPRNFLRPFRNANKTYLEHYVIMFEWIYNLKAVTDEFLRILLGARGTTELVP